MVLDSRQKAPTFCLAIRLNPALNGYYNFYCVTFQVICFKLNIPHYFICKFTSSLYSTAIKLSLKASGYDNLIITFGNTIT